MRCWTDYFVKDFGGGPRSWKFAWVINFQKTGTFPILAFLIAWYHNTSTAAWIYLAMHGSYGLVWIIKDLAFPDATWQPSLVQKLKEFCFILEQKIQTSIKECLLLQSRSLHQADRPSPIAQTILDEGATHCPDPITGSKPVSRARAPNRCLHD